MPTTKNVIDGLQQLLTAMGAPPELVKQAATQACEFADRGDAAAKKYEFDLVNLVQQYAVGLLDLIRPPQTAINPSDKVRIVNDFCEALLKMTRHTFSVGYSLALADEAEKREVATLPARTQTAANSDREKAYGRAFLGLKPGSKLTVKTAFDKFNVGDQVTIESAQWGNPSYQGFDDQVYVTIAEFKPQSTFTGLNLQHEARLISAKCFYDVGAGMTDTELRDVNEEIAENAVKSTAVRWQCEEWQGTFFKKGKVYISRGDHMDSELGPGTIYTQGALENGRFKRVA